MPWHPRAFESPIHCYSRYFLDEDKALARWAPFYKGRDVTAGPANRSRLENLEQHHKLRGCIRSDSQLLKNFPGDAEAIHGSGHAAVNGGLQEQLLDLFFADAVGDGALHVCAN